jgi:hypothetical protein
MKTIDQVSVFLWKTHAAVEVKTRRMDMGRAAKTYYISYRGGRDAQEDHDHHRAYRHGTDMGNPGGTRSFKGTTQYIINYLPDDDVRLALRWWKYYKLSPERLFQEKGLLGGRQVALSFALAANFLRVAGAYRLGVSPRARLCWGPDSLARFIDELIKKPCSGTLFLNQVAAPAWLDTNDLTSLHATNRVMRNTGYMIERSDVGRVGFIDSNKDDDDGGGMVYF